MSDTTSLLSLFDAIHPAHITPAIDALLAAASEACNITAHAEATMDADTLSSTLSVTTERLDCAWASIRHLSKMTDAPALRAAFNDNLTKVTEFQARLGADERLYARYRALAISPAAETLSAPRRQALSHRLRDFVLSGAELQSEDKLRFAQIQVEMARLHQTFSEHVLDATDSYLCYASAAELAGVPDDVKVATRAAAVAAGRDAHQLTLRVPVCWPVVRHADDRALRERIYTAYVTRASDLGPVEQDNSPVMADLLRLRQEKAALLGYPSHAEVSLVSKMAESPAQVFDFLRDLARRARPQAEREWRELREFAAATLGLDDLQAWDSDYASEKLKQARHAVSDQAVKPYFPEPTVLAGLFRITETLFDVEILPDMAPAWHASVRGYRIERHGRLIGQFSLDAYARPGKRPGAWVEVVRSRWLRPDTGVLQTPMAHLVCGFAPPAGDAPVLLTHDNVQTLFHEFGHVLHHLLGQVDELGVSGIAGVAWDAIELPSQFMENFCWEWAVLQQMTAHVETGEPLPRTLFDKMTAAKNFQSGLRILDRIELSLLDLRLHAEPGSANRIQQVMNEVRHEVGVRPSPHFDRFQHTFSHIFAGAYDDAYAAGYYSYLWAAVLSADAWSLFEEDGILNPKTGQRYCREILETGGARNAIDNFTSFRGRAPKINALLRQHGIVG